MRRRVDILPRSFAHARRRQLRRRRHVTRHIASQQTTALLTFAAQNMAPRSSDPLQVYLSAGPQCSQRSQYVLAGSLSQADAHMVRLRDSDTASPRPTRDEVTWVGASLELARVHRNRGSRTEQTEQLYITETWNRRGENTPPSRHDWGNWCSSPVFLVDQRGSGSR